ncbi:GntR family transcriptional regulator [uncultured Lactobacillus sp.]|uniref:GntR family transcriptional regulator n=1 Tax=uncultured Lactobacillus sp. TaxID=153152 RepID=UPI0026151389|nr:GntR family transcriptional regulator [uncultured Lactobacillus sp.]
MAKYEEIQQTLLKKISDGTYPVGSIIPKELELAKKYSVSRPTVNHAIQNLVKDGFLEQRKRRGTIVKRNKIEQEFTHVIKSYNEEMEQNGLQAKTKVLFFDLVTPPLEVRQAFDLDEEEKVYKLIRLRFADDDPLVLVTTYLPASPLPNLKKVDFTQRSLYDELDSRKLGITHVIRKLEVKNADKTASTFLNIEPASAVFLFHTLGYTASGDKLEYSIATYRGDKNYFMIDIDQSNSGSINTKLSL